MGRVRNDGDEQPLHHLAGVRVRERGLEMDLHALQAGIERWRRVSPYFMVGGGRLVEAAEAGKPDVGEEQWRQGRGVVL